MRAHGGVFLLLTILACVSPVFVDRHAGFGRVCTYSRCGIRIRPNQIELIGVDLVVILVALGPQSSLSVVGKPSAKRPEAVMVSVFPIFDGMVLLRRSCNRSGMTRLVVWSVSLFIESAGPHPRGVWRRIIAVSGASCSSVDIGLVKRRAGGRSCVMQCPLDVQAMLSKSQILICRVSAIG